MKKSIVFFLIFSLFLSSCTVVLPARSMIKNPRQVKTLRTHKNVMDTANNKDFILRWLGSPQSTFYLNGNEIWKYSYSSGTVEFTFQGKSKNVLYWRTNGVDFAQRTSNDTKRMARGFKMIGIGLGVDLIAMFSILYFSGEL